MQALIRILPSLVLVVTLWAPPARGAPSSPDSQHTKWARYHYAMGTHHYKRKAYRKAIEQFRKALKYRQHANVHLSMGMCHRKLKNWSQALLAFKRYLSMAPRARNRREVVGYVKSIQRRLAARVRKHKMGRLSVVTTPPGAAIYIDTFSGRPRGRTPTIIRVRAGAVVVEIRREGYQNAYRKAVVKPGDVTLLQVVLVPLPRVRPVSPSGAPRPRPADTWTPSPLSAPPPPVVRPSTPPPTVVAPPPMPGAGVPVDSPQRTGTRFWRTWWFWTGLFVGSVLTAGGYLQNQKAEDIGPDSSNYKDLKTGSALAYAGCGLVFGGVVVASVVTAVLYFKKRKPKRQSTAPRFSCGLGACTFSLQF